MKFRLVIDIDARTRASAEQLRDEVVGAIEDAHEARTIAATASADELVALDPIADVLAGDVLQVLVPRLGSPAAATIRAGSGIVARPAPPTITVYYEGNIYGAENLRAFESRVQAAADRLEHRYPTIARGTWPAADFVVVGTYVHGRLVVVDDALVALWTKEA